jgi:cardiolipin synthase A/B
MSGFRDTAAPMASPTAGIRRRLVPSGRDLEYVGPDERLIGQNRVTLLRRGAEAFPSMLEAIASGTSRIHLETYILRSDETGRQFQRALIERARAGVRVRLMYDSIGSFGMISDEYLRELAQAGVDIVEYRPVTPWRRKLFVRLSELRASADRRRGMVTRPADSMDPGRFSLSRRDHQKLLVVDDRIAFTGGLNIGNEYAPKPEGDDWYDLHARIEGPAARAIADQFEQAWRRGGGSPFERPTPEARSTWDPVLVQPCDNFRMRNRSRMHSAYRRAIRHAKTSISIVNAYFVPDPMLRWAIASAARRGVSVRIMVPSHSDVGLVMHASRHLFGGLLRAGARIFEYQGRMMHAKAAVIDGVWSTIGSFNLDRRSMFHNLEAGVVVLDREFGAAMEREFESSLAQCTEISPIQWRRRPWSQRLVQWFAHLFAYWL